MDNLREKFTKWYYRKGYRMNYGPCDYGDGVAEMIFRCPWWVRLAVEFLFSPSVYYKEIMNDNWLFEASLLVDDQKEGANDPETNM